MGKVYKTIDLCAGIGGIRRGFEMTGRFKNVLSAEVDANACLTYRHLFGDDPFNDISDPGFKYRLCGTRYDVLMAGFPCQAFSSAGKQEGFFDKTKGTVFFDIVDIIRESRPKAVFLENVQNLIFHDKRRTFSVIVDTLDRVLDYKIIGVSHDKNGKAVYKTESFVRNSKNFGVPQNRPRVYLIAFDRKHYGDRTEFLPCAIPDAGKDTVYEDLNSLLDKEVDARFFLSEGYLRTLEKHAEKQKQRGYGFGYRIVNDRGINKPIANTLLATGGSGRERNLILDEHNGKALAGAKIEGKFSRINSKCIRTMTPTEWGKLQGFIGYGFLDRNGEDGFSFPPGITNTQKYKQFGNSVTIPAIRAMAEFMLYCMDRMENESREIEVRLRKMRGNKREICMNIYRNLDTVVRESTMNQLFDIVEHFVHDERIRVKDLAEFLDCTCSRTSQIMKQLEYRGLVEQNRDRSYRFVCVKAG